MTSSFAIMDGFAVVRIARPEARGALRLADWQALAATIHEALAEPDVSALVLTGEGANFCAGADIGEIAAIAGTDGAPRWAAEQWDAVATSNGLLAGAAVPTIAALCGDAIGGGCGLALACDLRVAAPNARLGVTPAKLGIAYGRADTARLVDAVGPAAARRLLLTAEIVDAAEALRVGLVDRVADDALAAATAWASDLTRLSAHSQTHAKAQITAIAAGMRDDDADSRVAFIAAYSRSEMVDRAGAFAARRR